MTVILMAWTAGVSSGCSPSEPTPSSSTTTPEAGSSDATAGVDAPEDGWTRGKPVLAEMSEGQLPSLSMNGAGQAVLAFQWTNPAKMEARVWAVSYSPDGTWGTSENIETQALQGAAQNIQASIDAMGNAMVLWRRASGIHANRYWDGRWTGEETITQRTITFSEGPRMAMDRDGNAVVVWAETVGTAVSIVFKACAANGTWWAEETLWTSQPDARAPNPIYVSVDVDAEGGAVAAWNSDGIWVTRRSPSGSWQTPTSLGPGRGPKIGVDAPGHALAIWDRVEANQLTRAYFSEWARGAWQAPQPLPGPNEGSQFPSLAVNSNGRAVAAWSFAPESGSDASMIAGIYDGEWSSVEPVGQSLPLAHPGVQLGENVAISHAGHAVVSWIQAVPQPTVGSAESVFANVRIGSQWVGPANLGRGNVRPETAIDDRGNALVVWSFQEGADFKLMASHLRR